MLTPVLKFTDIKKDPNSLLGLDHAYICKRGDVVAHVVSTERMKELLGASDKLDEIRSMLDQLHSSGRLIYSDYSQLHDMT